MVGIYLDGDDQDRYNTSTVLVGVILPRNLRATKQNGCFYDFFLGNVFIGQDGTCTYRYQVPPIVVSSKKKRHPLRFDSILNR